MSRKQRRERHPVAVTDLVAVGISSVIVFGAASYFDVFDYLHQQAAKHEEWHLGELFVLTAFLAVAMCVFSVRRWSETRHLLRERKPGDPQSMKDGGGGIEPVAKPLDCPSLTVLLAEGNVLNVREVVRLLESDGHVVQCVANGREAVQAVACENFDLLLMDIQLPEMDGLEAARAIRQKEHGTGRHLAIIAMTSEVRTRDDQRYLQAGINDYLSKPIDPEALRAALCRWGAVSTAAASAGKSDGLPLAEEPSPAVVGPAAVAQPREFEPKVLDLDGLRARVEDDLDLMVEMLELYLDSSPVLMEEIEAAIETRDAPRAARAAHGMKGVLRNLCATPCAEAAAELETVAHASDFAAAQQKLVGLKERYDELRGVVVGAVQRRNA